MAGLTSRSIGIRSLPGHAAEQVVADEPGEHLRRAEREPGVGVGQQLGQPGRQVREVVEPTGRRLDVGVDVDDQRCGPHAARIITSLFPVVERPQATMASSPTSVVRCSSRREVAS